jgi:acylphosphatase
VKQEEVAKRFIVSGRVQGVGYRYYVEYEAQKHNISGYVRNRRDGRVEVYAMGMREQLEELRAALERGPMMSEVRNIEEEASALDKRYAGQFTIEMTI